MDEEFQELKEGLVGLRKKLPIDSYELERECREQPSLYDEIGDLATKAKAFARNAKRELELLEANLRAKVRSNPESYGIMGKISNDAILEVVTIQEDVQKAKQDYIDATEIAEDFSVLLTSGEQRKSMIRASVDLFVHAYYTSQDLGRQERALGEVSIDEIAMQRNKRIEEENVEEI